MVTVLIWSFAGCGGGDDNQSSSEAQQDSTFARDWKEIKDRLEETAKRWRYGDKAALYEMEFEYYQVEFTYDDYLEVERVKRMESDTVDNFVVKDIKFYDRDSATVTVEVVFVGVLGDTTRYPQDWQMYYHKGRWIRPSMSNHSAQVVFEEVRRKADSAAEAEENEEW
jgi:hypothetical protein